MLEVDNHSWPEYVYQAFAILYYGGFNEQDVEAFAARWGKLDLRTFERILQEGSGDDKVIAISALGYAHDPQALTLLAPLLNDYCAYGAMGQCYGLRRDARGASPPCFAEVFTGRATFANSSSSL